MINSFSINKSNNFILYGKNKTCEKLVKLLSEKGYSISGIIDGKFEGHLNEFITINGQNIRALNPNASLNEYKDDIAVICLNNGMNHRSVARRIFLSGLIKILYLPMDNLTPKVEASIIRQAYFHLFNGEWDSLDVVPCYRETDANIIDEGQRFISFWCPIDYVFTFDNSALEDITEAHLIDRKKELLCYSNIKISEYKPYLDLFGFLSGNVDVNVDDYLRLQRGSDDSRKALLEDRKKLYIIFENHLKYDIDFFTDSPTKARYNKKFKVFNVEDGLHRAIYLIFKGYKKIPLVVRKDDYIVFLKNHESGEFGNV